MWGYSILLNYCNSSRSRVLYLIINGITEAPLNYSYTGIFSIKAAATLKKTQKLENHEAH